MSCNPAIVSLGRTAHASLPTDSNIEFDMILVRATGRLGDQGPNLFDAPRPD